MTLKEIARPALLIAPDGWVVMSTKPEDQEAWYKGAVKRYCDIGIEVFSADDRLWKFEGFDVIKSPSFLESLRSWSMGIPPASLVNIRLREDPGNALERLLSALSSALEKDCDVLTQFKTKEKIIEGLKGAESVSDVINRLRKLRVVR